MEVGEARAVDLRRQRAPDAIVVQLEPFRRARGAQPALGLQQGHQGALVAAQTRHVARHHRVDRPGGEGQRLEECTGADRQLRQPYVQHLAETHSARHPPRSPGRRVCPLRRAVLHQLLDEKGIAAGLPHDRVQVRAARRQLRAQQLVGETPRLLLPQAVHPEAAAKGRARPREQGAEEGVGLEVLAREAHDQQHRGRIRRREEEVDEGEAVAVAPLKVVDVYDEQLTGRDATEQLSQRGEAPAAQLDGIGRLVLRWSNLPDLLHAAQDGKQLQGRPQVGADQAVQLRLRQRPQVASETVDDAIEAFVRHRLAHVTAPREHDRARVARHAIEEATHQGALPDARRAVHQHRHGLTAPRGGQCLLELRELGHAVDQRLRGGRDGARAGGPGRSRAAEATQDLGPLGATVGGPDEEAHAQLGEVPRHARRHAVRWLGILDALVHEDLQRGTPVRQPARERLVQRASEGVPVARRGSLPVPLLGGHVLGRAPDPFLAGGVPVVAADRVHGDAEVEDHDAAFGRHAHVGGLQIPVQLAGRVDRDEALGDLEQCGAQPRHVQPARSHVLQKLTAPHQLHREVPLVPLPEQLVQGHEIAMGDIGEGAEFALEAIDGGGVGPAQSLQGDDFVAVAVPDLVDDPHAAGAEPPDELEPCRAAEVIGIERHRRG